MRNPREFHPLLRLACILAALLSPNALSNTKSSSAASSAAVVSYAGPPGHVIAGILQRRAPPCHNWLALRGGGSLNSFRVLPGLEGRVLRGGGGTEGGRAKGGEAKGGGGTTRDGGATGGEAGGDGLVGESEGMSLGDSDVEMGGTGDGMAKANGSGAQGGSVKGGGVGASDLSVPSSVLDVASAHGSSRPLTSSILSIYICPDSYGEETLPREDREI